MVDASSLSSRIWDPATGATRHTLTGHTSGMWKLLVAPDGSWLASGDYGGEVRIWDPATGATRHNLTGHTSGVSLLRAAPDGSWLASAGGDPFCDAAKVQIWGPVTGTIRHTLTGHTGAVWVLGSAPDGSRLASAGVDGKVRIWDPATGATRHTLIGHTSRVPALVIAPDGPGWPRAVSTGRCGFGIRSAALSATPSSTTPAGCRRWGSPRMSPGLSPLTIGGSCGSGTPPQAQHSRHRASRAVCSAYD